MSAKLERCKRCGEEAHTIQLPISELRDSGKWFASPLRRSRCKLYKPHTYNACRTGLKSTELKAIEEWNATLGAEKGAVN